MKTFTFILRLSAFIILIYILYKVVWKGERFTFFRPKHRKSNGKPKALEEMKKDPICGTYLPESQAITYNYQGQTHYFCSQRCKQKFQRNAG